MLYSKNRLRINEVEENEDFSFSISRLNILIIHFYFVAVRNLIVSKANANWTELHRIIDRILSVLESILFDSCWAILVEIIKLNEFLNGASREREREKEREKREQVANLICYPMESIDLLLYI